MSVSRSICCLSYGWNNGSLLLRDIMNSFDLCLIQERWLFDEQLFNMNIDSDFLSFGVSGMDSSVLLHGRQFGGCAFLFRKSLAASINTLQTDSKRFCALKLIDSDNTELLLINVYLPTDYGTSESYSDFLQFLGELEGFIDTQSFDNIAIIGDFNVDFDRDGPILQLLKSFMDDTGVIAADLAHRHSISYTSECDDSSATSWIDHVLCDATIAARISDIKRLDYGSNLSDHHPIGSLLTSVLHLVSFPVVLLVCIPLPRFSGFGLLPLILTPIVATLLAACLCYQMMSLVVM